MVIVILFNQGRELDKRDLVNGGYDVRYISILES
jgi:hypothetical protein